jgi:hypothetical protein
VRSQDPSTISWGAIARYLDGSSRPRCAAFVRQHEERLQQIVRERDELRETCDDLRSRLHKYEPPAPVRTARSYKPRAEASD